MATIAQLGKHLFFTVEGPGWPHLAASRALFLRAGRRSGRAVKTGRAGIFAPNAPPLRVLCVAATTYVFPGVVSSNRVASTSSHRPRTRRRAPLVHSEREPLRKRPHDRYTSR